MVLAVVKPWISIAMPSWPPLSVMRLFSRPPTGSHPRRGVGPAGSCSVRQTPIRRRQLSRLVSPGSISQDATGAAAQRRAARRAYPSTDRAPEPAGSALERAFTRGDLQGTFATKNTESRDRIAQSKLQLETCERRRAEHSEITLKTFELSPRRRKSSSFNKKAL